MLIILGLEGTVTAEGDGSCLTGENYKSFESRN